MSDGGEAVASGSRSPHLNPLTGSESSEEVAKWLANFQQLYQPKLHNANYQTVLTFLVANTAQGTPAWALLQSTQHDADWLKKALAASKDAASGGEKQAVAKAAAELFTIWDDAVRKEFVTKRNKLESSQLHTIKVSGKKDRPEHIAKLMEQEVERVAPEYNMEQLQRVVVDAFAKHSELHQYLREWVKSSEGMEAVSTHDEAHSDIDVQPTAADDHHQVAYGEKSVDLMKTMQRCWMDDLNLGDEYVAHAIMHAAQIINRTPMRQIDWRVPFTIATNAASQSR